MCQDFWWGGIAEHYQEGILESAQKDWEGLQFLIEKLKVCIWKTKTAGLQESNERISEEIKKMMERKKNMKRNIKDQLKYCSP